MNCFLTAVLRAATVRFNPRAAAVLGAGYTFNACKRLIYEKKRTLELYHFLSLYTAGSFYFLLEVFGTVGAIQAELAVSAE